MGRSIISLYVGNYHIFLDSQLISHSTFYVNITWMDVEIWTKLLLGLSWQIFLGIGMLLVCHTFDFKGILFSAENDPCTQVTIYTWFIDDSHDHICIGHSLVWSADPVVSRCYRISHTLTLYFLKLTGNDRSSAHGMSGRDLFTQSIWLYHNRFSYA